MGHFVAFCENGKYLSCGCWLAMQLGYVQSGGVGAGKVQVQVNLLYQLGKLWWLKSLSAVMHATFGTLSRYV